MPEKKVRTSKKKEQFIKKQNSKVPLLLIALLVLAVTATGIVMLMSEPKEETLKPAFGEPVAASRSYIGRFVSMTPVTPLIEADRISIPLELIEAHDIVYFEVENNEGLMVPLMAYITPTGRVFTGSSMCEPCQGRYFSLAGETLVCDTCRTTYTIESHEFISGSQDCGKYPPVYMKPVVENGMVSIALNDILQWQVRTY